jgi:hypothetical protein
VRGREEVQESRAWRGGGGGRGLKLEKWLCHELSQLFICTSPPLPGC